LDWVRDDAMLLKPFASQVQSIVVTRCAACHDASYDDRQWRLQRPASANRNSRAATRGNLASTVAVIDSLSGSRFMEFATQRHGGQTDAAIRDREVNLIRSLRSWTRMVEKRITAMEHSSGSRENDARIGIDQSPVLPIATTSGHPASDQSIRKVSGTSAATRLPPVSDPYSASQFNRQTEMMRRIDWPDREADR
ncbi:MAG: hypothetical protein AAF539_16245, partial [Planctomycetota bacterium]